jgi:AcrR family transcriptional regulator
MTASAEDVSGIGRRRQAAAVEGSAAYRQRFDELVQAAAQVFREKGYGRATVGDIAKAMGTDRATVYYYVPNKAALFRLVVREKLLENTRQIEAIAASSEPGPHKLRAAIRGLMTSFHESYPYLYVYVQEDLSRLETEDNEWSREMAQLGKRYDRSLIRIVQQGLADGSLHSPLPPKVLAYSIIGMLNWSYRWFQVDGPMSGAEIGDALADLVLSGLTPATAAAPATAGRSGARRRSK